MAFHQADLRTYAPEKPSLVVSLHACGPATDMALALGVRAGADAIACVPCCHQKVLSAYRLQEMEALMRHGPLRERMNAFLTDSLRVLRLESLGYEVTTAEYVSPLDTPRNLLITARRVPDGDARAASRREAAAAAYARLCRDMGVRPAIEDFLEPAQYV